MVMQDHFQFYTPTSAGIRSLVSNFFYIRSSDPSFLREQMVLPYPQLTLGFFLKSPFQVKKGNGEQTIVRKYVFSRLSKDKVTIRPLSDEIEILGVNLKPFALRTFTHLRADQLEWHEDPQRLFQKNVDQLYQEILLPGAIQERVNLLEDFLTKSVVNLPDPVTVRALEIIHQNIFGDALSVKKLAEALNISDRSLRNHFSKEIGLSPVDYLQLVRLHSAVNDMKGPLKKQADIYFDNNFFDQAHFIHAFKRIAEISPKKFQKQIAAFRYLQF